MDTVTESEMAIAMALCRIGLIHYNIAPSQSRVTRVKHHVHGLIQIITITADKQIGDIIEQIDESISSSKPFLSSMTKEITGLLPVE